MGLHPRVRFTYGAAKQGSVIRGCESASRASFAGSERYDVVESSSVGSPRI